MSITDFLLARIAEDEAAARLAMPGEARWSWASVDFNSPAAEAHGNLQDPARALREAEAKRRILERHQPTEVWIEATIPLTEGDLPDPDVIGRAMAGGEKPWGWEDRTITDEDGKPVVFLDPVEARCTHDIRFAPWPCPDVLTVAAIYSDHPDYRDEWRT